MDNAEGKLTTKDIENAIINVMDNTKSIPRVAPGTRPEGDCELSILYQSDLGFLNADS